MGGGGVSALYKHNRDRASSVHDILYIESRNCLTWLSTFTKLN